MQIFDAWVSLAPGEFARLLGIPAALLVAALLPGRGIVRLAASVVAVLVLRSPELGASAPVAFGWAALWAFVAWRGGANGGSGDPAERAERVASRLRHGVESGVIALPLGLALVGLMLAALARQQLDPIDSRRATVGALVLGAGLLHVMLRRHVRRATLAFAAVGLGLELLAASARAMDAAGEGAPAGAALLATALVVVLVLRVGSARERHAGSPLVSDAHELRD